MINILKLLLMAYIDRSSSLAVNILYSYVAFAEHYERHRQVIIA